VEFLRRSRPSPRNGAGPFPGESNDTLISMKARVVAINAPRRITFAYEEERRIVINQRGSGSYG